MIDFLDKRKSEGYMPRKDNRLSNEMLERTVLKYNDNHKII